MGMVSKPYLSNMEINISTLNNIGYVLNEDDWVSRYWIKAHVEKKKHNKEEEQHIDDDDEFTNMFETPKIISSFKDVGTSSR